MATRHIHAMQKKMLHENFASQLEFNRANLSLAVNHYRPHGFSHNATYRSLLNPNSFLEAGSSQDGSLSKALISNGRYCRRGDIVFGNADRGELVEIGDSWRPCASGIIDWAIIIAQTRQWHEVNTTEHPDVRVIFLKLE